MTPNFARLEIAIGGREDILQAVQQMRALATELQQIAASVPNEHAVRVLAHDAIRATSGKTRISISPSS